MLRTCSLKFVLCAGVPSDVVITARNKEALDETKQLINSQAPGVSVHVVAGDIGDMTSLSSLCTLLFESIDMSKHTLGILVNNAGTMNSFNTLWNDPGPIQDFMGINFTSMVVLTTRFLSAFPPSAKRYVINITTILATLYVSKFVLYSASRAARNAFIGVLGADLPDVRLLSYSPGPCVTDMYRSVPRELFSADIVPLTPKQSIEKLVWVLKEDKFKNSAVIDYYDD